MLTYLEKSKINQNNWFLLFTDRDYDLLCKCEYFLVLFHQCGFFELMKPYFDFFMKLGQVQ